MSRKLTQNDALAEDTKTESIMRIITSLYRHFGISANVSVVVSQEAHQQSLAAMAWWHTARYIVNDIMITLIR